MKTYKNEAAKFKLYLESSRRILHADDCDFIWEEVIQKVLEEYRDENLVDKPKIEYPFTNSERPDIYYEGSDFILGIECFQIDSSSKVRKGSSLKIEKEKIDRDVMKEYYKQQKTPFVMEMPINTELTYKNYVDSLINSFSAHACKINDYRNNLKEISATKKVIVAFFIEDMTDLGSYIDTSKGREPLIPLCIKEFIDELNKYEGLDYVITKSRYGGALHIQQITPQFIKSLYTECYSPETDQFVSYKIIRSTHIG